MSTWAQATQEKIRDLHAQGLSDGAIAKETGLSHQRVTKFIEFKINGKRTGPWTDEITAKMLRLNEAKLSTSEIARQLGDGFSRNSVIGKLRRMGVEIVNAPTIPREQAKRKRHTAPKLHLVRAERDVDEPEPLLINGAPITTVDLERGMCRWPHGDGPDLHYCGHSRDGISPYCLVHRIKSRQERVA